MDKDLEYLNKYLDKDKLEEGTRKLKLGIPVQYIVGNVNFYGYEIKVNKNVLIPRFETEELVSKLIGYINKYFNEKVKIADLGTGSGCISIVLKKKIDCDIDAVDISRKALRVAKENIVLNNTDITLYHGNMLDPLTKKYDVIVSNPPYIAEDEEIMAIVKNNEPKKALHASLDGLYYYQLILEKAKNYLNKRSIIAFEIGYNQAEKIKAIALKYFPKSKIKVEKDMQDMDRFVFIFNDDLTY